MEATGAIAGPDAKYLTIDEAARRTPFRVASIWAKVRRGEIQAERFGHRVFVSEAPMKKALGVLFRA